MSDIIQLLPDNVANQIAAGEVVQRPSSLVKELLENSIDAGATDIQLIVKEAGRNLIQVIDNGKGMSVTDARMAFERHATSKIKVTEDIFKIDTKGFRGEALASISAVAQVELKTKREEDELGTQVTIEGGDFIDQIPVSTTTGTSFAVKNLFYNVPARRKFLKSNSVEFRHILDEFHRVALAHEDISFRLFNNDQEYLRLRGGSLMQRVSDVFGRKIQPHLVPIQEKFDWVKVKGFVGKPEVAKKARGEQFLFVNNRYFKSNYFNKAIQDAYEGLLMNGYSPSFFLYIDIEPERIDVNIHPTKTEIKFEDEVSIFALLKSSIKKSLGIYNVVPSLDFEQNPDLSFIPVDSNRELVEPKISIDKEYNPFKTSYTATPSRGEKVSLENMYSSSINREPISSDIFDIPESIEENIFMRITDGRWVKQEGEELWLIDPYRIHQTVLYSSIENSTKANKLSQQLLFPIEKLLDRKDTEKIEAIKLNLFGQGFDLELLEDKVSIQAIPSSLNENRVLELLEEVLAEMEHHSEEEFLLFYSKTFARVSAKKRNEFIQSSQVDMIWREFEKIGMPEYNPNKKKNYMKLLIPKID